MLFEQSYQLLLMIRSLNVFIYLKTVSQSFRNHSVSPHAYCEANSVRC